MRRVFKDQGLEDDFQKNGYTIIPFLEEEKVAALKQQFFDLLPQSGGNILAGETGVEGMAEITYDFTFIDKNIDYKRKVFEVISKRFKSNVDQYLDNYKPIIANYIRKKEHGGEVPLHQNWAFVDEHKFTSVSVWCPLVDSNEENGTLQVVPGSHKRFGQFRGPMVPWELDGIKSEIIGNYLVPMNIKAGQAVVLDDSIVHYSNINKTSGLRLAIQLIMIPAETPSIHYHMNPQKNKNLVEMLEVDKDFFMSFNPWKQPENVKRVKNIPFKPFTITETEFKRQLSKPRFDEKPRGWLGKFQAIFKG